MKRPAHNRPAAIAVGLAAAALVAVGCTAGNDVGQATEGASGSPQTTAGNETPGTAVNATPATAEPSPSPTPRGTLKVSTNGWQTDFEIASINLAEIDSGGPGKDGIPAIDDPQFESISEALSWQDDEVPVIAVEINGEARAYPLSILIWHEIVNDTVGGVPVVVTFCPLCNTSLVFERELDGVVYDFGTTGNLRFSDLVMYDRQTESWWQQATGEAIVGVLTGTRLNFLPTQVISLSDFAAAHDDGVVLSRETGHNRQYGVNPYFGYDFIDQDPFLFRGVVDDRLPPKERVAAVEVGGETVAYPYTELATVGVVEDVVGDQPIVVFWRPGVNSPLNADLVDQGQDMGATGVFSPFVDDRRLSFALTADGTIIDRETKSTWTILGEATDGPLAGKQLEPIVHGNHFWFAWAVFEPETRIWTADE